MIAAIDTSSLISLVRYYLPFDNDGILYSFIKGKIAAGEIIIIDKILEECKYLSKGIVLETLAFLKDPEFLKTTGLPINTELIFPPAPAKFFNLVEHQFINSVQRKKISDVEFESVKNDFMESADMKLILYCLNHKKDSLFLEDNDIILVTEETGDSNDSKTFKKIPAICKFLNINVLTLPQFLAMFVGIDVNIK